MITEGSFGGILDYPKRIITILKNQTNYADVAFMFITKKIGTTCTCTIERFDELKIGAKL
jgi:hypothetical protein